MKTSEFTSRAQQFYGNAGEVRVANSGGALEVPQEQMPVGARPVHFWLILVALLVVVRILYEAADKA